VKAGDHFHKLQSIAISALLFAATSGAALAEGPGYSFGDGESKNAPCISCHGNAETVGKDRFIDPNELVHTTHGRFGCTTCHDAVTESHPDGRSIARTTNCGDCHGDVIARYGSDFHLQKVSCTGCHNPHRVFKSADISADEMNRQCGGCHHKIKILASHSRWLPQADLHLESIACITCHSKAEDYVITIYIGNRNNGMETKNRPAGFDELNRLSKETGLQWLIDRNRDNYISLSELQSFNSNPAYKELYLKGMLTPLKPTHSFLTFDNRWDCTFCHASGPEIMQTSYVAFPEKNGTFRRVAVEKGAVLKALQSSPDFYLMGSARNNNLNKIGLLIIAGGMIMPVGHGFLRFLTRKNRQEKE